MIQHTCYIKILSAREQTIGTSTVTARCDTLSSLRSSNTTEKLKSNMNTRRESQRFRILLNNFFKPLFEGCSLTAKAP